MPRNREQFDIEINVQQILLILKRRWPFIIAGGLLGAIAGGIPPTLETPIYVAGGTLQLIPQRAISVAGVNDDAGLLQPTSPLTNPLATELLVLKSRPILTEVVTTLDLKNPEDGSPASAGLIGNDISAEILQQTDVIRISYTSNRPQEAVDVVNTLMETYIRHNIKTNRAQAEATRKFIDSQLPEVESELENVELALRQFKEQNNINSLEREAGVVTESLLGLESQRQAQQRELLQIDARLGFLSQQLGLNAEEAIAANALTQSPGVRAAYQQLQAVEQELTAQQARFTAQNPTVQALLDQKQRLEQLLNERVDRVAQEQLNDLDLVDAGEQEQNLRSTLVQESLARLGVERSLAELDKQTAQYRRRSEELPRLEQKQRELERKLGAAQLTYETLLAGLQEASVKENQEVGNARIVSRAVKPSIPANAASIVSLELIAGGILGACLGLSAGLLLEMFDHSLRTEYEARGFFKRFPILGTIPAWNPDDWELNQEEENDRAVNFDVPLLETPIGPESLLYPVSVAYRRLQANLKLLNVDRRMRVIAITSSIPGEGKSVTAANLALMLANLSNRVLLLEADLSAPQQHKIWKLSNIWGLSNILQDQITPEQTIQPVTDNLDVLSAGVGSPGVVALLDSDRMAITVRRLAEVYDYVIIDSPSLLVAPEIVSLGQLADGVMMVVRPGVLNKVDAATAQDTIRNMGMELLGIIVNGVLRIPLHIPTTPTAKLTEPDTHITEVEVPNEPAEVLSASSPDDASTEMLAQIRRESGLDDADAVISTVGRTQPNPGAWRPSFSPEKDVTVVEVPSQQANSAIPTTTSGFRRTSSAAALDATTLDVEVLEAASTQIETQIEIQIEAPGIATPSYVDTEADVATALEFPTEIEAPTEIEDPTAIETHNSPSGHTGKGSDAQLPQQPTQQWMSAFTRPWKSQ